MFRIAIGIIVVCLCASSAFAQGLWRYEAGFDALTASVTEDGYTLGVQCVEGDINVLVEFPRNEIPKSDSHELSVSFATDLAFLETGFPVSRIRHGWAITGENASVRFGGEVAETEADEMRRATRNVFISVATTESTPRPIFRHQFTALGALTSIGTLNNWCPLQSTSQ